MNLYVVSRWGNEFDDEGPDGDDTNYVVSACNEVKAAQLVDLELKKSGSKSVVNFCHRITRIGTSTSVCKDDIIIIGPFIAAALMHDDKGISNKEKWVRECEEDEWLTSLEYFGE